MCTIGCARSLGFALLPLATCCILANVLLFFPNGDANYAHDRRLHAYVWYFMGIGGGGVTMLLPALVFVNLGRCASTCGTESCAMCGSILAALVGMAGSGYCFFFSILAMLEGPFCFTEFGWQLPFAEDGGRYLFQRDRWSQCVQPAQIVEWNVTLLSTLIGLSALEFLICTMQLVNGLVNAVCRPCCYKQEYSLNV